jgi:hypothetical protein
MWTALRSVAGSQLLAVIGDNDGRDIVLAALPGIQSFPGALDKGSTTGIVPQSPESLSHADHDGIRHADFLLIDLKGRHCCILSV